jgi:hypothetical protein
MLFFIDESGIDRQAAPYVVLAAVSIHEDRVWPLVLAQRKLKERFLSSFDPQTTIPQESQEPKTSDLLRAQAFKLAGVRPWLTDAEIESCVREARLRRGQPLAHHVLAATNQGKIRYVEELLALCKMVDARVFATVTEKTAPIQKNRDYLGKDFSFLFQRVYAYLEQQASGERGLLVFDERDDAFSKKLIDQMHRYFCDTMNGQLRAARVLPSPFFARSHLMPALQVADAAAYIINWAFRAGPLTAPKREELVYLALRLRQMQFVGTRVNRFATAEIPLWGITRIGDLRPRTEQELEENEGSD